MKAISFHISYSRGISSCSLNVMCEATLGFLRFCNVRPSRLMSGASSSELPLESALITGSLFFISRAICLGIFTFGSLNRRHDLNTCPSYKGSDC